MPLLQHPPLASQPTCPGCGLNTARPSRVMPTAMAALLGLSLVACGDKDEPEDTGSEETGSADGADGTDYGVDNTFGITAEAQQAQVQRLATPADRSETSSD